MQIVSGDMCMKCQIPFSRKNKKYITNLSFSESAHCMVSVNGKREVCTISNVPC